MYCDYFFSNETTKIYENIERTSDIKPHAIEKGKKKRKKNITHNNNDNSVNVWCLQDVANTHKRE